MTNLPAPEPPAGATNPPARRDDGPHATLTFYWDRDGLTAHGPYPGLEAADEAADRMMRADHTAATYPLALAAPGPDPVTTQHTTETNPRWCTQPTLWVRGRLSLMIRAYTPPLDHDGPVVALIRRPGWPYAVLAGPFPSAGEAAEWSALCPPRASHLRGIRATVTILPLDADHLAHSVTES